MLNLLSKKYNKNDFGLYLDDGLVVLKNKSEPQSDHVKKNIQKIFKEHALDIIIQCNMKIVNYLDVTFDLNGGTYKPYKERNYIPNNEIKYIHKDSNHRPSVIREIQLSAESTLSILSFNEKIYQEAVPPYQKAFQNSGHRHTFTYKRPKSTNINKIKRNRKQQTICINPPFNLKTKSKIGNYS